jgi:hypothetical protein
MPLSSTSSWDKGYLSISCGYLILALILGMVNKLCEMICNDRLTYTQQEEFEDTKGVIRKRKSKKNSQHNGQKYQRGNQDT